ncbi:isochorismatase family protein [Nonomuraea sp. NPDC050556]|uniref:isochorismatase family protein n=1 Tax=Nonomuraea sp. NPDC050556 TaxID=3364369 RepID=UPI0037A5A1F8
MTFTAEALIVTDMQQGFLDGHAAVPDAAGLTAVVSDLLNRARRAGALIVHLQNDGPVGEPDEPGKPGWELVLAEPGEPVIRKTDDDGFEGTTLGSLLEEHEVKQLVICGLLSEMCVSATARTALWKEYAVALPRNAHATYDLDDIPAAVVARVAEHALGDEIQLPHSAADVRFTAPPK